VGADVDVPALVADHGQVGQGRLGAGQHDQICVARQGLAAGHEGHLAMREKTGTATLMQAPAFVSAGRSTASASSAGSRWASGK
jgi:hypothetical protein